jgi:c-di-GMP-binding flagellar brake protein YcgR
MQYDKTYSGVEKRENTRWQEKLTGDFVFIDSVGSTKITKKQQGIINNISAEGICLEISTVDESWEDDLFSGVIKIVLSLKLPSMDKHISAIAKVVWMNKVLEKNEKKGKYVMGLTFCDIATASQDVIKKYIIDSYFKNSVAK